MGLWSRSRLLLLLLMIWVPAALSASACTNTDPCVLSCEGCDVGETVPAPENCRQYYVCTGSNPNDYYDLVFDCESGYVFDPITHHCEEGDSCEECPAGPCVYECPASGSAKIPSFTDCNKYYICTSGYVESTVTCDATTPFFDGYQCQADESRCCHCHAYCYANSGFVADPLDCRQYYVCLEQGTPTYVATCPDGEYFSSSTQECSEQASCVTQCTNVVGPDGCIEPFTCLKFQVSSFIEEKSGIQIRGFTVGCERTNERTNEKDGEGYIGGGKIEGKTEITVAGLYTGLFAKCPNQCTPLYYHCTSATGEYQAVESCEGGTVFHPTSHACVSQVDCP